MPEYSFVPSHIFLKEFLEGNFIIPRNDALRRELRERLWYWAHYGLVCARPDNRRVKETLEACIAALDAYGAKIPRLEDPKP